MRRAICLMWLFSLLPAGLLVAQPGELPQMMNEMVNPARYQQSAPSVTPALRSFGQHNVFGWNGFLVNSGFGSNFRYQWPLPNEAIATLDLSLIYLDFSNRFLPYYSPQEGNANIVLVPLFFGVRRDVWREHFDQSIAPYVQAGAGPLAGFAIPAGYSFWRSLGSASSAWTVGGFAGFGVNFAIDKKTAGLFDVRYNVMIFPDAIGPRSNYSGPAISFGVLRGF
ncbi:MAG: hypothetical protein ONA90_06955 [candidate division KSB1 bacterium]|nr:hypothetical protein [candidate division KSB1 bacterium]